MGAIFFVRIFLGSLGKALNTKMFENQPTSSLLPLAVF